MKRSTIITIAVAAAFGAMLLYSTLTSQNVECTVTVEYNGRSNSATASGASEVRGAASRPRPPPAARSSAA